MNDFIKGLFSPFLLTERELIEVPVVAMNRQLENTLEEAVTAMGYQWVGCEWVNDNGHHILRVYIDTDGGILLDQCAKASRELSAILDVEDSAPSGYRLEVSSPGIQRPLFRLEHYAEHVGKRISLKLRVPTAEGRRRFKGLIKSVDDTKVHLAVEESEEILELVFSQIEKANLIVDI
jgi:ribosome maturation factor RimP